MSKFEQIKALGEAKRARVTRIAVKPVEMKPLAADFKYQPEIVAVNVMKERRRGRPLASDAHLSIERTKPWVAAKMSRRTFYRRRAEERKKKDESNG